MCESLKSFIVVCEYAYFYTYIVFDYTLLSAPILYYGCSGSVIFIGAECPNSNRVSCCNEQEKACSYLLSSQLWYK